MNDPFTCKHCWNFHAKGKAEQGTCRARLTPVKKNREERCTSPKDFIARRIVVTYAIIGKQGGRIEGITDINQAIEMCNDVNEQYRMELLNCRKEQEK